GSCSDWHFSSPPGTTGFPVSEASSGSNVNIPITPSPASDTCDRASGAEYSVSLPHAGDRREKTPGVSGSHPTQRSERLPVNPGYAGSYQVRTHSPVNEYPMTPKAVPVRQSVEDLSRAHRRPLSWYAAHGYCPETRSPAVA